MTVYKRGPEYKEVRAPLKERPKEREFGPRVKRREMPILNNSDFHEEIMTNIKQLRVGKQGLYENFMRQLRNAEGEREITKENLLYYKALADKQMQKQERKEIKKAEKEQNMSDYSESSSYGSNYEEKLKKEEAKAELEGRKVRGEDIEAEEKIGKKGKIAKFKQLFTLLKSPIGRVGIFIILGVFLIFYLTKNSMSEIINSPIIIILAVLFIILILGRGGKTRSIDSNKWF